MDQHPVPRQITTFEFKLIGFLTIKQFIYLIVFIPLGFIVYVIFPIPIVNILFGLLVGAIGLAFAFLPVNDRPLDVWIRNMFRRLTSPTQYQYRKNNPPIYFLKNLFFAADPHRIMTHIQSQELLASYLAKTSPAASSSQKQNINDLIHSPVLTKAKTQPAPSLPTTTSADVALAKKSLSTGKQAFFTGVVKNHKLIPIPGILIYVKDDQGQTLRLLKTNPHGVFATFNPLPEGEYNFEIKDSKNTYLFDTIKLKVENTNLKPLEFFSKELL